MSAVVMEVPRVSSPATNTGLRHIYGSDFMFGVSGMARTLCDVIAINCVANASDATCTICITIDHASKSASSPTTESAAPVALLTHHDQAGVDQTGRDELTPRPVIFFDASAGYALALLDVQDVLKAARDKWPHHFDAGIFSYVIEKIGKLQLDADRIGGQS